MVGAGIHSCWLGVYEGEKPSVFASELRPGDVVLDIGAHVGYYTLLAADTVGPAGHVFAFEPVPRNLAFLLRNANLNSLANVTALPMAVSDHSGLARFREGPDADGSTGQLDEQGSLIVPIVRLDQLDAEGWISQPRVVKIDVEGAEHAVLVGAKRLLAKARPTLFLAFHGRAVERACRELLSSMGYRLEALDHDFVRAVPEDDIPTLEADRKRRPRDQASSVQDSRA